jgi:hypothetical protein
MADVNGDGRLDLYVCFSAYQQASSRANQLFINQGNNPQGIPVFREMAHQYGLDDTGYSSQAAFFDYDHDGGLDMVVGGTLVAGRYPLRATCFATTVVGSLM